MDWTCIYELCPLSGASWMPVMGEEENEREWGGGCDEMRWTEGKRTLANQLYIHIFIFLHFLKLFYKRLKNYINLFKWLIFGKGQIVLFPFYLWGLFQCPPLSIKQSNVPLYLLKMCNLPQLSIFLLNPNGT